MPLRGELSTFADRSPARASATQIVWSNITVVVRNRDLQCVGAFCAIGLLLTINLILLSSDFAATVASLQMLP
jgi:hypothetical protein